MNENNSDSHLLLLGLGSFDEQNIYDKTDFFSNEIIHCAAEIAISGEESHAKDVRLDVKVKKVKQISVPEFVDSKQANRQESKDDEKYYVKNYYFDEISSGTEITLPFNFKFETDKYTLNGDKVEVEASIYAGNVSKPVKHMELTYVAKVGMMDTAVISDKTNSWQMIQFFLLQQR